MKSRRELESEISQVIIHFEKECMGRGPLATHTRLLDDLVVIRLEGVLTVAEMKLADLPDRGVELIKEMRQKLLEAHQPVLIGLVEGILGRRVSTLLTDLSTRTGERVIVLVLDRGRVA